MIKYAMPIAILMSSLVYSAGPILSHTLSSTPPIEQPDERTVTLQALICANIKDKYHHDEIRRLELEQQTEPGNTSLIAHEIDYHRHQRGCLVRMVRERIEPAINRLFPGSLSVLLDAYNFPHRTRHPNS